MEAVWLRARPLQKVCRSEQVMRYQLSALCLQQAHAPAIRAIMVLCVRMNAQEAPCCPIVPSLPYMPLSLAGAGNICSGHGTCGSNGDCTCQSGFFGTACSKVCPSPPPSAGSSGPTHDEDSASENELTVYAQGLASVPRTAHATPMATVSAPPNIEALPRASTVFFRDVWSDSGTACEHLCPGSSAGTVCNGHGACNSQGSCTCQVNCLNELSTLLLTRHTAS